MSKGINSTMVLRGKADQFKDYFSREIITLRNSINLKERSFQSVIITEFPMLVFDWLTWLPIREIILIEGIKFPVSKKIELLNIHSRFRNPEGKGFTGGFQKVNDSELKNILIAKSDLSKSAESELKLMNDEKLISSSIAYLVNGTDSIRLKTGESTNYKGRIFRNNYEDGLDLFIRLQSELKEHSLNSISITQAAKFRVKMMIEKKQERELAIK